MPYRSVIQKTSSRELNLAWQIANTGRKGPVLIDLPMNVQRGEVEDPVYDMKFSEEEIEAAVYGKNDPENGSCFLQGCRCKGGFF